MSRKHAAFNLVTGEVLTTNHANHLKRWVARNNRWSMQAGQPVGCWVFAHGKDWSEKLVNKVVQATTTRL